MRAALLVLTAVVPLAATSGCSSPYVDLTDGRQLYVTVARNRDGSLTAQPVQAVEAVP